VRADNDIRMRRSPSRQEHHSSSYTRLSWDIATMSWDTDLASNDVKVSTSNVVKFSVVKHINKTGDTVSHIYAKCCFIYTCFKDVVQSVYGRYLLEADSDTSYSKMGYMTYNLKFPFMKEDVGNVFHLVDEDLRGKISACDIRPFDSVDAMTSQNGPSTSSAPQMQINDADKPYILCAMLECINIVAGSYVFIVKYIMCCVKMYICRKYLRIFIS
jgi:hypothetical protein